MQSDSTQPSEDSDATAAPESRTLSPVGGRSIKASSFLCLVQTVGHRPLHMLMIPRVTAVWLVASHEHRQSRQHVRLPQAQPGQKECGLHLACKRMAGSGNPSPVHIW